DFLVDAFLAEPAVERSDVFLFFHAPSPFFRCSATSRSCIGVVCVFLLKPFKSTIHHAPHKELPARCGRLAAWCFELPPRSLPIKRTSGMPMAKRIQHP